MDYQAKLNLLNVNQLKGLIRKYSLETKIVMSKRKKSELITDILKHTELVGNEVKVKNISVVDSNTLNVKVIKEKKPKVVEEEKPKVVEENKPNKKFLKIPDVIINYVMKFDSNKYTSRENEEILNKDLGITGYRFENIISEIFKGRDKVYAEDMNDKINDLFNDLIVLIEKKEKPKKKEKKVVPKEKEPEEDYEDLDQKTIKKIEDVKSKLKKLIDGR